MSGQKKRDMDDIQMASHMNSEPSAVQPESRTSSDLHKGRISFCTDATRYHKPRKQPKQLQKKRGASNEA